MKHLRDEAGRLIQAGEFEAAVAVLCSLGPPDGAEVCGMIAHAYHRMNRTRGDVHSARVFAERALECGSEDPLLAEIVNAGRRPDDREAPPAALRPYALGGWRETRAGLPSTHAFCALSRQNGMAEAPRDFHWLEQNIPCQKACPAATDIPAYLDAIYRDDPEAAYRINLRDNVFPAVLGRVCARPCEGECRHGWDGLGQPVAICFSKRSAADFGGRDPVVLEKLFPPSGRSVAVVGAGVAGLAVARELALFGHQVTVYEKHSSPGGMLNQGIPVFRLPREIIRKEIAQIESLGVVIRCGSPVGPDLPLSELAGAHDAVVLAAGTLRPNLLDLPGRELRGIRHGLEFLLDVNEHGGCPIGRNVVVIGGGFTAMDCARTARRLGAQVRVCYRRTVTEMLVTPGELEELEHEGIPIEYQVTPTAYVGHEGRLSSIRFVRTEMGEPDAAGRRRPVAIPGSEFDCAVDTVLLATGQFPDTSWIDGDLAPLLVSGDGRLREESGHPWLFVAGDFKSGASSLIEAIGHAKACSRAVDRFLTGADRLRDVALIRDVTETGRIREMDAVELQPMPTLPLPRRDLVTEVEQGFDRSAAVAEAQRCYQCHYKFEIDSDKCIYCDWCIKVKPRPDCILKIRSLQYDDQGRVVGWQLARTADEVHLIWINQQDCIRCGACVAACPVDCISLQKVSLATQASPGPESLPGSEALHR